MKCYISKNYKNLTSAGSRAKRDVETTLDGCGYRNIGSKTTLYADPFMAFVATLRSVAKALFLLKRGDILLLQYPLKKYYSLVCIVARLKGAKTITLIHDLGSFRRRKLTPSKEIKRLSRSSVLIAHNESMKRWLEQHGCNVPIVTLDIWDYLSSTTAQPHDEMSREPKVVYAGGLSPRKNSFLYEVGSFAKGYSFRLYGRGFDSDKANSPERFKYMGFTPSDELIATVDGDFGLVWDGDSVEECSGNWGEYLRYNNPHKTSLYIRCELPLIIWREAALATFVEQHHIGICVDSLTSLNDVLSAITPQHYREMKQNVVAMSKQLSQGHYIQQALERAYNSL